MKKYTLLTILFLLGFIATTQPLYLPLNQEYNRSLQKSFYSNNLYFHTSIRPYFILNIEKAGIKEKIQELLKEINYEDTKQLEDITKQVRELILNQFQRNRRRNSRII